MALKPIGKLWGTAAQVGRALDTSGRNIENWAKLGDVETGNGGYEFVSAAQNYVKKLKAQVAKSKHIHNLTDPKTQAEVRKLNAEADIKELQRDEMKGELVNKSEIVAAYQDLVIRCRAKMLALPSRVTSQLVDMDDPLQIEGLLSDVVDEALNELSE